MIQYNKNKINQILIILESFPNDFKVGFMEKIVQAFLPHALHEKFIVSEPLQLIEEIERHNKIDDVQKYLAICRDYIVRLPQHMQGQTPEKQNLLIERTFSRLSNPLEVIKIQAQKNRILN